MGQKPRFLFCISVNIPNFSRCYCTGPGFLCLQSASRVILVAASDAFINKLGKHCSYIHFQVPGGLTMREGMFIAEEMALTGMFT